MAHTPPKLRCSNHCLKMCKWSPLENRSFFSRGLSADMEQAKATAWTQMADTRYHRRHIGPLFRTTPLKKNFYFPVGLLTNYIASVSLHDVMLHKFRQIQINPDFRIYRLEGFMRHARVKRKHYFNKTEKFKMAFKIWLCWLLNTSK